jgi:single-strand selective monofunctional uracil DNA glycosylase
MKNLRVQPLAERMPQLRAAQILHPSPASPVANRDWAGAVTKQLEQGGVWGSNKNTYA